MYVRFSKLTKGDSYKFMGGCLIAVYDVIDFAQACFSKWIAKLPNLKKMFSQY